MGCRNVPGFRNLCVGFGNFCMPVESARPNRCLTNPDWLRIPTQRERERERERVGERERGRERERVGERGRERERERERER